MSLTNAALQTALDAGLTGVTHVEWSENGSTVSSNVDATAVTMESATITGGYCRKGIDVASPPLLSDTANAGCTITHFRFTTASTGGTAKTNWNALTSSVVLSTGGQISLADAALYEKLTAV
jgi:hypothetical protein